MTLGALQIVRQQMKMQKRKFQRFGYNLCSDTARDLRRRTNIAGIALASIQLGTALELDAMLLFAGRRLIQAIPILIGVSLVVFGLVHIVPGNPIDMLLPPRHPPRSSPR